jgi:MoaA/NifB/PqqE/SkfB family radical SAM enzyme
MGITYCAITGGEPLLWNGGSGMCCADLVSYGRSRGLRMITLYTNGTQPLQGSADVYFVSVDGPEKVHNALRGETFAVILENMKHADAPVFINSTINAKNKDYIEQLCDFVVEQNTIRAIFFYFHTPYYGFDELFIEKNQRKEIIDRIIRLKSKGYPIVNSYTGCTMYANDSWYGPTDLCIVYAYNNIFTCCRAIGNRDACDNCGYIGYIELSAIASLKFEAITNALKYAPLWPHRSA